VTSQDGANHGPGPEPIRGRLRRPRRSIYLLPSFFTVGNIFAGFFAVISTLHGNFENAAVAIGIAVVLDGLDGRIARMTGATSDFGLQLDSLADVISFGIAPAVLIYSWGFGDLGNLARLSAFFFLICGTIRLARFNVQVQDLKHFAGLPIPAGAGFIAAVVHLFKAAPQSIVAEYSLVAVTYCLGFLMVSTLRYPSPKQLHLGKGKSHLTVLLLALLVAGVIWYSEEVLMAVSTVYVLSGVTLRGYQMIRYRMRNDPEKLSASRAESD